MRCLLLFACWMLCSFVPIHAQAPESTVEGFDEWVHQIMQEWNVPGVAVGAIKDGKVVLLEGYGYRDLEDQLPMTPQTLLAIGSNSKSFTTVLLGQLVDSGIVDWNTPVHDYLPDFRLHDEYATAHLRVRDLLTHVSGLPRHDGLWYGRSFDREELFQRLQYLEPSTSFRGRYQYQNLMFMTAGYLIERLTGETWDHLIRARIFQPLGMARSNTSVADMPGSGDFSYPYQLRDSVLTRVPFRNIDNVGPAGSIDSSVEEMLKYIQMHLDSGLAGDTRILSEDNVVLMQTAQSVTGRRDRYPELGPSAYGLGLGVTTYRGHKLVRHGGGIDGFISAMAWLPNDDIGVMVLSNMSGATNPVPTLVSYRVFDALLGLEAIDWNARTRKDYEEGEARREEQRRKREAEQVSGTSPSHHLTDYAGVYEHAGYGRMEITETNGALHLRYDLIEIALDHFHYDVFEGQESDGSVPLEGLRMQFLMSVDGTIDRLAVALEPNVDPIVFTRVKEPESEAGETP